MSDQALVVQLQARLSKLSCKLSSKAAAADDETTMEQVLDILHHLQQCRMTVSILRQTLIGRSLKRWKRHAQARTVVKALLEKWKQVVDDDDAQEQKADSEQSAASTCRVVNVKVAHIRPKYQNLQEWMQDTATNVYIGRSGVVFIDKQRFPKRDSPWANPFQITKTTSRQQVLEQYETHLQQQLIENPILEENLLALDGKHLGCWCHPEACHGDVLKRMITKLKRERAAADSKKKPALKGNASPA